MTSRRLAKSMHQVVIETLQGTKTITVRRSPEYQFQFSAHHGMAHGYGKTKREAVESLCDRVGFQLRPGEGQKIGLV